jgi:hypothetical protein
MSFADNPCAVPKPLIHKMFDLNPPTLDSSPDQGNTSTSGPTTGGSTNAICCPKFAEIANIANLSHEHDEGDTLVDDFISQLRRDQTVKLRYEELGDVDYALILEDKQKANIDDVHGTFFKILEGRARVVVKSAGTWCEIDRDSLKAELKRQLESAINKAFRGRVVELGCKEHQGSITKIQVLKLKDIFGKVSTPFPTECFWCEYIIRGKTIRC